jgi:predicted RNA-binding Zn-ribbon protein involved in translation (DUF1610 family)
MLRELWLRLVLRPLGRLIGTDLWEPHAVYVERCTSCGWEGVCVIRADSPLIDEATGQIFSAECPACGLDTVDSL